MGPGLWLWRDFLTIEENAEFDAELSALPRLDEHEAWRPDRFAYRRLVIDGEVVEGRLEASCGTPIWSGQGPVEGAPVPESLRTLMRRADTAAGAVEPSHGEFSSLFVDWYEAGGSFVPHTDRSCYGPFVCGISVGEGHVLLRFFGGADSIDLHVPPRALYVFGPPLRFAPWKHEVREVTGRRFGVTLRTEAA